MKWDRKHKQALEKMLVHCDAVIAALSDLNSCSNLKYRQYIEDSLVLHIGQLGELSYSVLSVEFKKVNNVLPWQEMEDMRHKLVHHYDNYSLEIICDAAANDVPVVIREVKKLLREQFDTGPIGKMKLS